MQPCGSQRCLLHGSLSCYSMSSHKLSCLLSSLPWHIWGTRSRCTRVPQTVIPAFQRSCPVRSVPLEREQSRWFASLRQYVTKLKCHSCDDDVVLGDLHHRPSWLTDQANGHVGRLYGKAQHRDIWQLWVDCIEQRGRVWGGSSGVE